VMDRMTSGGGAKEMPLWGLVPEGTARADNSGIYAAQQVGELPGVVTASSLWPLSTLD